MSLLEIVRPELIDRVAPLGVRFRDDATGTLVGHLTLRAWPEGKPHLSRNATVNSAAAYVFQDLPGLRDLEWGRGDAAYFTAVPRRRFTVRVDDETGRFLSMRFSADVPHRGFFELTCDTSPPFSASPAGRTVLPVFSAPSRTEPGLATLRAEIWNVAANAPASGALVEVIGPSGPPARGVADEKGKVAILFQYPEPIDLLDVSSSVSAVAIGPPLIDQHWAMELRAFHAAPLGHASDLCAVLSQPPASLWTDLTTRGPAISSTLFYAREAVVKTAADPLSRLLLSPLP